MSYRSFGSGAARCSGSPLAAVALVLALAAIAMAGGRFDFQVIENTGQHVVVQSTLTDFSLTQVDVDGQTYSRVSIPREAALLAPGAPDLVNVARSLMIPDHGSLRVTLDAAASSYYDIPNVLLAPSKGNLSRTLDPADVPYVFDDSIYGSDAFFPGTLASADEPYILRDVRGATLRLYPFQYNPVRHTLRVYTSMQATVEFSSEPGVNEFLRTIDRPSVAFEDVYAEQFVNYDADTRYAALDEVGNMLVICYDAWLPNIAPFVAHKNAIGIPTTAVGVSTIGNNATAIKNYIQNVYNQGNLAFVLLVGDATQVATPTASGGSSDPSYAKLAGGDNYPDIMVGRFSAETAAQVDTQVARSVNYEEQQIVLTDWFKKGVGIASAQGAGQGDDGEADYVHMDNIRNVLMNQGGYTLVNQIYDTNGGTAAMVTTALNQGRGVINYCGHGSDTSWGTTGFSNSNVNALTNQNKLPFIFSVACVNGNFAGQTCFAEAWLRATNGGQPTGAVAVYMSSINQSWAPPMQAEDHFNDLLVNPAQPYHCLGTLFYAGSCSMMDQYGGGSGGAGTEMYDTWHIFGDPSLRVIGTTAPPSGLTVAPGTGLQSAGEISGPFSPNSVVYTLENLDPTELPYTVTKTQSWLKIENGSGVIPAHGTVQVTVRLHNFARNLPAGTYSDTLTFANATGGQGTTTRPVQLTIGGPTQKYSWNLDTNPGWAMTGQWAFGHPTGLGGASHGSHDPSNGYTGSYVYGVNLNGDYSTAVSATAYTLTTGAINCTGLSQISLRFQRWLNTDYEPYVQNLVQYSLNGVSWTNLWNGGGAEIADGSWTQQTISLSPAADNQPTVYLRWSYKVPQSGAWPYSGWNIDDVEIYGLGASGPQLCFGDMNCDGAIDFADIDPFVEALGYAGGAGWPNTCPWIQADINGDGNADFADIDAFVEMIGMSCP